MSEEPDRIMHVTELFNVPADMELRGDEIHDPANWRECTHCGVNCRDRAETCFNCGEILTDG